MAAAVAAPQSSRADVRADPRYTTPGPTRDVRGEIRYMRKNAPPGNAPGASLEVVSEEKPVNFLDARTSGPGPGAKTWDWDVNIHGFTLYPPPPAVDFHDKKAVREIYGPELVEIGKKLTGAMKGYFYQFLTRGPDAPEPWVYSNYCHSDFGAPAVPKWRKELVDRFKVPEAEAQTCDICMLNVWTPWGHPAYKNPLCLLDASTLTRYEDEVEPIPLSTLPFFYPHLRANLENAKGNMKTFSKGAGAGVAPESLVVGPIYSPHHRWVFCSDMTTSEAWWFKQYDTRSGVAKCTFHNSFPDPFHADDPSKPPRLSGEFRMLLTFPNTDTQSKL